MKHWTGHRSCRGSRGLRSLREALGSPLLSLWGTRGT